MRIYLTGYMGSGKSTLGRKLARHAGLQFVDMDHYIEERNCKSVPRIFAEEGEAEFRKKERKHWKNCLNLQMW
jgi:shikimate kinase